MMSSFVVAAHVLLATPAQYYAFPGGIESTKPSHVLILPGRFGADEGTRVLARLLQDHGSVGQGLSVQLWDWTRTPNNKGSGESKGKAGTDPRLLAQELVDRLRAWRSQHPNDRLYLLALADGSRLAQAVCEKLGEPFFERILLLSATLRSDVPVEPFVRCARTGVFNYSSDADTFLVQAKGPAVAGREGFPPGSGTRSLRWLPEYKKLGNWGGHLQCLSEPFIREKILPVFEADPNKAQAVGWQ